jgi:hypothetical protein
MVTAYATDLPRPADLLVTKSTNMLVVPAERRKS